MKLWSDFYDLVAPDVPGCPVLVLDNALRQSAIEFCQQSLSWKYAHPDIILIAGQSVYPFDPPDGAVVYTISYAAYNGKEVQSHVGESSLRDWDWRNQTGAPDYVMGGASLTVVPTPDVAGPLTLIVVLQPSPDAAGVDDRLFNDDREAIIHGALSRLMLSPKKPYTSSALAVYHQQQFAIKTNRAGSNSARYATREPLQTTIMRRR